MTPTITIAAGTMPDLFPDIDIIKPFTGFSHTSAQSINDEFMMTKEIKNSQSNLVANSKKKWRNKIRMNCNKRKNYSHAVKLCYCE